MILLCWPILISLLENKFWSMLLEANLLEAFDASRIEATSEATCIHLI
jgi:hypothetical protein